LRPRMGCTCRNMEMGAREGEGVGVRAAVLVTLGDREEDRVKLAVAVEEGLVLGLVVADGTGVLLHVGPCTMMMSASLVATPRATRDLGWRDAVAVVAVSMRTGGGK